MNEIRLCVTIAPKIEEELINNENYKNYREFFTELINFSKELEKLVIIWLPYNLKFKFKNCSDPFFKNYYSLINNQKSNIQFYPSKSNCSIIIENDKQEIYGDLEVLTLIGDFFKAYTLPYILDTENNYFNKRECNIENQKCKKFVCSRKLCLSTSNIFDSNKVLKKLSENCGENLKEWYLHKGDFSITDLRKMFYIAGYFCKIDNEDYDKLNSIYILEDEFINDIKNVTPEVFKNIATSILRAILYPSARDTKNRTANNIDWHENYPSKYKGYSLYRLDVIDLKYSGYKDGHSGTNRILIAIKENKKYILYFIDNHDFINSKIEKRIDLLISKMH